jgi:hypothetical protein
MGDGTVGMVGEVTFRRGGWWKDGRLTRSGLAVHQNGCADAVEEVRDQAPRRCFVDVRLHCFGVEDVIELKLAKSDTGGHRHHPD